MTTGVVLDTGALDELLPEAIRAAVAMEMRDAGVHVLIPSVVITEFLPGHVADAVRAERVLKLFDVVTLDSPRAWRAARLLVDARKKTGRDPGTLDAIVAATAEELGSVVTRDFEDFSALSTAGRGFVIHDLAGARELLRRSGRAPRRRGRGTSR